MIASLSLFFKSYFISSIYYEYILLIAYIILSGSVINYYYLSNNGTDSSSLNFSKYYINFYYELSISAVGDNIKILFG